MREPRRAEGRRCMEGAVMDARRVTSPATIVAALHRHSLTTDKSVFFCRYFNSFKLFNNNWMTDDKFVEEIAGTISCAKMLMSL